MVSLDDIIFGNRSMNVANEIASIYLNSLLGMILKELGEESLKEIIEDINKNPDKKLPKILKKNALEENMHTS